MVVTRERKSKDERREEILDAALVEFAGTRAVWRIQRFFGVAMLMNLLAALHLVQGAEPWADRIVASCASRLPKLD